MDDLTCAPSFHPATPHAGFVSNTHGSKSVQKCDTPTKDTHNSSDTNSLDDSDTDGPIVSTKAHGATTAMRQQLKTLSDSSTGSVKSDDAYTQIAAKSVRNDKCTIASETELPSSTRDHLRPPATPSVPTAKQTTPAALAAGARLVGARVGPSDHQPTSSTSSTSRAQHRMVTISNSTVVANLSTTSTTKTTSPQTSATPARSLTPAASAFHGAVSNTRVTTFLSHLQQQGMDILYPQTVHDQVSDL